MEIKKDKKALRIEILKIREGLSEKERDVKDNLILNNLYKSDSYKSSKNIFVYVNFRDEINTIKLIERALLDNKNIYVPKVYNSTKSMKAIFIDSLDNLERNKMGILEPKEDTLVIDKNDIDLIIVPGAVFDKTFNRIGYGGGYYDKYLEEIKEKSNKVALAYDFQIIDKIEAEIHDIKMDYIITEKRILVNSN
ncbi:5-formyltetrahydrofolate cyclo-ligase [Clostridium sp.]|uniref:5-formyltetrahydrofolate cyclo-ligase n=1 Tax=Clostridium sp. TaxID=1506 RepID=UPI0026307023|nr:5-formyltetrahydrofolate cyclo-ligase [Clostridium sp.]